MKKDILVRFLQAGQPQTLNVYKKMFLYKQVDVVYMFTFLDLREKKPQKTSAGQFLLFNSSQFFLFLLFSLYIIGCTGSKDVGPSL